MEISLSEESTATCFIPPPTTTPVGIFRVAMGSVHHFSSVVKEDYGWLYQYTCITKYRLILYTNMQGCIFHFFFQKSDCRCCARISRTRSIPARISRTIPGCISFCPLYDWLMSTCFILCPSLCSPTSVLFRLCTLCNERIPLIVKSSTCLYHKRLGLNPKT